MTPRIDQPVSLSLLNSASMQGLFVAAEMLEALCDVLEVEPGELMERDKPKRKR